MKWNGNKERGHIVPDEPKAYEPYKDPNKERKFILTNLWLEYGGPEKMTIHVEKTGETILLIEGTEQRQKGSDVSQKAPDKSASINDNNLAPNGGSLYSPSVDENGPMPGRRRKNGTTPVIAKCTICSTEFKAKHKDSKYCSKRCAQRATRERLAQRRIDKVADALAILNQAESAKRTQE